MKRWLTLLAVALLLLVAACNQVTTPAPELAPPEVELETLQQVPGNSTCQQLLDNPTAFEIKIDPPVNGTFGPVTVMFNDNTRLMDFTSTVPVDAVFVKGGPDGGHLYSATSYPVGWNEVDPLAGYPAMEDSNMGTNGYNDGRYGISHVSLCWNEPPPNLTVSKTAAGTFDRTVTWTLDKSVDDNSHSGQAGDIFNSTWSVVAAKSETLGNYLVVGEIAIKNIGGSPATFTVSDKLSDGTMAAVICPTYTLAAGASISCTYTASPASNTATMNYVTVTMGGKEYTAVADILWTGKLIGYDYSTLIDGRFGFSQEISASTTKTFPDEFTCPTDASLYVNGEYSFEVVNTAILNGNLNLSDSETVTVDCTLPPLEVTKTAAGTFDRTVTWTLDKTVAPPSHSGYAGQTVGTSIWTVVANKTETLGNYKVAGIITIHNPAAIPQTFTVSDMLNDGTAAIVDCPSHTVGANETVECTYTASPLNASATENIAMVSAAGNADQTATAPVSFTEHLIGYDSGTLTDPRFGHEELISGDMTLEFEETFTCPGDANLYRDGRYSFTEVNTATLNGAIGLEDSATVTVDCTLPALVVVKDAAGTYERNFNWDLVKTVDDDDHNGNAGELAGISNWSIVATKTEVAESNFAVTGTITIINNAAIPQAFIISDMLNDSTVAGVDCPSDTVPANNNVTCTYKAMPPGRTATKNTATVEAAGNGPIMAEAAVGWTATLVNDSAMLSDPHVGYGPTPISDTTTLLLPEEFLCSADPNDYEGGGYSYQVLNTATLAFGNSSIERTAEVTVDCSLPPLEVTKDATGTYDRTVEWKLSKSVDPASHSGYAGQTVGTSIWTVVANKTETLGNYQVAGTITIHNPAAIPQTFMVEDVMEGASEDFVPVNCSSYTVAAGATVTCSYGVPIKGAMLNIASVTAAGNAPVVATAAVSYTEKLIGFDSGTLSDPRFAKEPWNYAGETINGTTTRTFEETFVCPPTYSGLYVNDVYSFTETNTAYLNGNLNLEASAEVTVDCRLQYADETATGAGTQWPGTSNWFMYTAYTTSKVDLIAGQFYDAGDIFMSRSGTTTIIRIVLHDGWRWAPDVRENLKVEPLDKAPTRYMEPGSFQHRFTVNGSEITVSIPNSSKAKFFGIHGDVERLIP